MEDTIRVGVVGCGLMGSGIAEIAARRGLDVVVAEATTEAMAAGRERVNRSLDQGVRRGKLGERERDEALSRLRFTDELKDLADRQVVIEAIAERRDVKTDLFRRLDGIVADPKAILATNTSSIPVIDLATATARPEQVIGMHFFNPATVQPLVELIPAVTTGEQVLADARRFVVEQLGKHAIQAPDRSGFVVNALLVPYLLAAVRMVESGAATPEDIDAGMENGCAHPMGPLRLLDLIGLDTAQSVAESLFEEYKEPLYAPPPLLRRMVSAGRLGRKSGRGFYVY